MEEQLKEKKGSGISVFSTAGGEKRGRVLLIPDSDSNYRAL